MSEATKPARVLPFMWPVYLGLWGLCYLAVTIYFHSVFGTQGSLPASIIATVLGTALIAFMWNANRTVFKRLCWLLQQANFFRKGRRFESVMNGSPVCLRVTGMHYTTRQSYLYSYEASIANPLRRAINFQHFLNQVPSLLNEYKTLTEPWWTPWGGSLRTEIDPKVITFRFQQDYYAWCLEPKWDPLVLKRCLQLLSDLHALLKRVRVVEPGAGQ